MQKLISIIVPIYNMEKYLIRCLNSIKCQSFKNFEVILIDDGSTDNSANIAKEFCKSNSNFNYYVQENCGVGSARNYGISLSKGTYICFIDPDDEIEKDYLLTFINLQNNNENMFDLIITQTHDYHVEDDIVKYDVITKYSELEILGKENICSNFIKLFINNQLNGPVCKLYKKDIIVKNNILFPKFKRSQDIFFNLDYYFNIESLLISNSYYYKYYVLEKLKIKKINFEYYQVITMLYASIIDKLSSNNICVDDNIECLLSTKLFGMLLGVIEAFYKSKMHIKKILEDETIKLIITKSAPKKIYMKILRIVLLRKKYYQISILFFFKKILKKMIGK